jgi:hypothetical protein
MADEYYDTLIYENGKQCEDSQGVMLSVVIVLHTCNILVAYRSLQMHVYVCVKICLAVSTSLTCR